LPAVSQSLDSFQPEMVFYIGGADPYHDDQLGGLSISLPGLKARDKGVFEEARKRKIPVVTALAGGYARRIADTVQIHVNTVIAAREVATQFPHARPAGN
jgi:acetoin utilization deacetylase AcuC-like enzyme